MVKSDSSPSPSAHEISDIGEALRAKLALIRSLSAAKGYTRLESLADVCMELNEQLPGMSPHAVSEAVPDDFSGYANAIGARANSIRVLVALQIKNPNVVKYTVHLSMGIEALAEACIEPSRCIERAPDYKSVSEAGSRLRYKLHAIVWFARQQVNGAPIDDVLMLAQGIDALAEDCEQMTLRIEQQARPAPLKAA